MGRHGGDVHFFMVGAGGEQVNSTLFTIEYDSPEALGAAFDAMADDAEVQALTMRLAGPGSPSMITAVSMAMELPVGHDPKPGQGGVLEVHTGKPNPGRMGDVIADAAEVCEFVQANGAVNARLWQLTYAGMRFAGEDECRQPGQHSALKCHLQQGPPPVVPDVTVPVGAFGLYETTERIDECGACPVRRAGCAGVGRHTRILEWLFRNRQTGEITIGQWPNASLLVFIGAWSLRWVLNPSDGLDTVLTVVATGALMIWAIDELVRGVNPWRRILGGGVLVWQVTGLVTG